MNGDIGESIVGAYLRYVEGCDMVLFNAQLSDQQGEVDVIGVRLGDPVDVFLAEVATHLDGMLYGDGTASTVSHVSAKMRRAHGLALKLFPDYRHHLQVWSPRVPVGATTVGFDKLVGEFASEGIDLTFVINDEYGKCVQQLIEIARSNRQATSDPAFRLLQLLCRVTTPTGQLTL